MDNQSIETKWIKSRIIKTDRQIDVIWTDLQGHLNRPTNKIIVESYTVGDDDRWYVR